MKDKVRNVLFISYRFPPEASAGSIRSFKFAKYLGRFSWRVTVLSVSNPPKTSIDYTLLSELPDESVRIVRLPRLEPDQIRGMLEKILPGRFKGIGWRVANILHHIYYPDFAALWQLLAIMRGILLCCYSRYDVIYSTYAPASNHTVAMTLSRLFSIPWVADFRDLWLSDFEYKPLNSIHGKLDIVTEKAICQQARYVLTTSTGLTDIMRKAYPAYADKIITLPNGYDPDDFRVIASEPDIHYNNKLTFVHVGTLYSSRSIEPLLIALDTVVNEHPDISDKIMVKLIGHINKPIAYKGFIKVEQTGWQKRQDAIQKMSQADVCVLILHSAHGGNHPVPQKLYEYLAFGHFILAIGGSNCFSQDILNACGYAIYVDVSNSQQLLDALRNIISMYNNSQLKSLQKNLSFLKMFSRIELASRLAHIFNSCAVEETHLNNLDFTLDSLKTIETTPLKQNGLKT